MHFTLWNSNKETTGGHKEIAWTDFLDFVSTPTIATSKDALSAWSPARFRDNCRARKNVEAISDIVLDDDSSGLPIDQVVAVYSGVAGIVHTTFSSTPEAPKYRIVLRCSRDMTPTEHARVWSFCAAEAAKRGQTLDAATRDPSRLWYNPAHREGAMYEWRELGGDPLPVDDILAATPPPAVAPASASRTEAPADRRKAAAATLGTVWPATGRHLAQLALAGGLIHDGWSEEDAITFLRETCRFAGDEDPEKRAATVRDTIAKRDAKERFTGWTVLTEYVAADVVQHVRDLLSGNKAMEAKFAEAAAMAAPPVPPGSLAAALYAAIGDSSKLKSSKLEWATGGYNADLPPIDFWIDGLIARGDVVMLFAHGNSLKTWLAFSVAHAIASGRPWLGRYATKRGRVGILDFESGNYEVLRRLKMIGVRDEAVEDRLMRASYSGACLTKPETWLDLAESKLDLLVIDSFNGANPSGDENDARAALMLQLAGAFAEYTGCIVVFIHHARKGSGGDERESVRGSTAIYGACDRVFKFVDVEKKDGGIVLATMTATKDGAGRSPADIRVELSDQGLRWVELSKEPVEEEPNESVFRTRMIDAVEKVKTGISRENLIDLMPGTKTARREIVKRVLAELLHNGVLTQHRFGRGQIVYTRNWEVAA